MSIKKIWCGVVLLVCLFPAIALAERDVNEYEYVILAGARPCGRMRDGIR